MGITSMPTDRRPILHAVITAVPDPENGSNTDWPPDISRHFSTNDVENPSLNLNHLKPARPLLPWYDTVVLFNVGSTTILSSIVPACVACANCIVNSHTPTAWVAKDSY